MLMRFNELVAVATGRCNCNQLTPNTLPHNSPIYKTKRSTQHKAAHIYWHTKRCVCAARAASTSIHVKSNLLSQRMDPGYRNTQRRRGFFNTQPRHRSRCRASRRTELVVDAAATAAVDAFLGGTYALCVSRAVSKDRNTQIIRTLYNSFWDTRWRGPVIKHMYIHARVWIYTYVYYIRISEHKWAAFVP